MELKDNQVILNERYLTPGDILIHMKRDDDILRPEAAISIEGTVYSNHFVTDLTTAETARLYVEGIDVYDVTIDTKTEDVVYRFHAESFRVKYRPGNVVELQVVED